MPRIQSAVRRPGGDASVPKLARIRLTNERLGPVVVSSPTIAANVTFLSFTWKHRNTWSSLLIHSSGRSTRIPVFPCVAFQPGCLTPTPRQDRPNCNLHVEPDVTEDRTCFGRKYAVERPLSGSARNGCSWPAVKLPTFRGQSASSRCRALQSRDNRGIPGLLWTSPDAKLAERAGFEPASPRAQLRFQGNAGKNLSLRSRKFGHHSKCQPAFYKQAVRP